MKINWKKVWKDFDKWLDKYRNECPHCKHIEDSPEWDLQQAAIQRIINKCANKEN